MADIVDKTGEPESEESICQALQVVTERLRPDLMMKDPKLSVFLPTIRRCLIELLEIRKEGKR